MNATSESRRITWSPHKAFAAPRRRSPPISRFESAWCAQRDSNQTANEETAKTALIQSNVWNPFASPTVAPSTSASSEPMKIPAEPSEIASVRESTSTCSLDSFVTRRDRRRCDRQTRNCPANANSSCVLQQAHAAADRCQRSRTDKHRPQPAVEQQPAGIASTTYSSGKICASQPIASSDTP